MSGSLRRAIERGYLAMRHPEMIYGWWKKRVGAARSLETIYIECSGRCNLACRFCFLGCTPEPLGLMERETFSAVARRLFPFAYAVNFVGYGEPLLNELLPWMIGVARSYGREAHLTTNGILLSEEKICELIAAGVDSIAVSLDGATAETHDANRGPGSYRKTVRNMEILKRVKKKMRLEKPSLAIDTLLTTTNRREIPDLLSLARRVGAVVVNLAHVQACSEDEAAMSLEGRDATLESDYRAWREEANRLGIKVRLPCEFSGEGGEGCFWDPERRLAVSWDGEIRPCCFLFHSNRWYYRGMMIDVEAPRFGNIRRVPFLRIWQCEPYRRFREKVARGEPLPPVCAPCLLRSS